MAGQAIVGVLEQGLVSFYARRIMRGFIPPRKR